MKKATWLLAATLIGSSVIVASPSSAQVQFGIGPNGPNIQVGPDDDRRYERRIERRRYEDRATTGSIERVGRLSSVKKTNSVMRSRVV
jgi:hypothetical protein